MNDFEYLRLMPVGQYYPTGSVIHRLDARVKLLGIIIILLCMTFTSQPLFLLGGIFTLIILYAVACIPFILLWKTILSPLPFLLILAGFQVFFNAVIDITPIFSIGNLIISWQDFLAGGMLIVRFSALVAIVSLASFTLTPSEVTSGLEGVLKPLSVVGFPTYDLVTVIQVTLHYLPFLVQTAERIAKAQASRGGDWGSGKSSLVKRVRQIIPLIVPLFLVSLRRAENLALAMDARGYGSTRNRTSITTFHLRTTDYMALLFVLIVLISTILLEI
jgi:energy-coupling factor transport system permease protein